MRTVFFFCCLVYSAIERLHSVWSFSNEPEKFDDFRNVNNGNKLIIARPHGTWASHRTCLDTHRENKIADREMSVELV